MKKASILLFKEKLQKFENSSEVNSYYLISSVRIKSLLFIFRVCRLYDGSLHYCFTASLCTSELKQYINIDNEDFVPLDLFNVYLSKMKFISVFCLLSKLGNLLSK